jgi:hypothetical protein
VQRGKALLIEAVINAADGDDSDDQGPDADDQLSPDNLVKPAEWPEGMNWGTLSLDTSCTPADPTVRKRSPLGLTRPPGGPTDDHETA